jgi:hypothetical protein
MRHDLWCAGGQDVPGVGAAARCHVDEVIGGAEQVQVVVYDDDSGACVDQPVEHTDQGAQVEGMQSGGQLVEDVQGVLLPGAQPGGDAQSL